MLYVHSYELVREYTSQACVTSACEQSSVDRHQPPCCPPNAPNRFENVPMPASVNDRLNRWSCVTPYAAKLPP